MATHSSILAWKIPWIEEPGRLVHRVNKESDKTENNTAAVLPSHISHAYYIILSHVNTCICM